MTDVHADARREAFMKRLVRLAILTGTAAACGGQSDAPATADAAMMQDRPPTSAHVRQLTGLTYLPFPRSQAELARSLARHYPPRFIGLRPRTAVLVDVTVDARGTVRDVAVVDRPSGRPAEQVSMVVLEKAPGTNTEVAREVRTTYDQAFGPAAQAALEDVRFLPAIRDGKPVPYTIRMTVEFTSPSRS